MQNISIKIKSYSPNMLCIDTKQVNKRIVNLAILDGKQKSSPFSAMFCIVLEKYDEGEKKLSLALLCFHISFEF